MSFPLRECSTPPQVPLTGTKGQSLLPDELTMMTIMKKGGMVDPDSPNVVLRSFGAHTPGRDIKQQTSERTLVRTRQSAMVLARRLALAVRITILLLDRRGPIVRDDDYRHHRRIALGSRGPFSVVACRAVYYVRAPIANTYQTGLTGSENNPRDSTSDDHRTTYKVVEGRHVSTENITMHACARCGGGGTQMRALPPRLLVPLAHAGA